MKQRDLAFILILGVSALVVTSSMAWGMGPHMMWPLMRGWSWMGWGIVAFWVLIIAGGYLLLREFTTPPERRDSALDVARERYARGEITLEEFEEIKKRLT